MTATAPAATPSARRLPSASLVASRLRHYLPALVVLIVVLVVWEVWTGGEGRRVIPPPSRIGGSFIDDRDLLFAAAAATYYEAIGGLIIGTVAGVLVAFAAARWTIARDVLLPVAIGASAIPLVAAAPIMIGWFGILNPLSMMMMAALISFFPIMINVTRGLVQVHPSALELMRSYATTPSQVLRKVRVPNMLPFFFTALKVSTTLAFIGAIVGEYFGGASKVIGKVVMTGIANGSFDLAWAGIIIGACGAIVAYLLVSVIERLVIPWYAALRSGEI
jgi:NitT/TauT family transport system permease protein